MTTLIRGGTVVTTNGARRADIRLDGPLISDIGDLNPHPEEQIIDAHDCLVLPGGIDTHTHLDLECGPDLTTIDDFISGSRAALAGGTTTVIDFATQFHGETLHDGLRHWQDKAAGASCDYAFHLAMTEWRPEFADHMADMVAAGVTSFKLYMAYRGSMMVEDDDIRHALKASAALGTTIGFHCENGRLIDALVTEELNAGHHTPYYHRATRPPELEREAINRLGVIAAPLNALHYVVHLSSGTSLPEILAARARGAQMVAETCPQYLVLDGSAYGGPDDEDLRRRAYVMSPPLRTSQDRDDLWDGLARGDIQFVGTDHCSFTLDGQKSAATDFAHTPNGAPGLETRLPLLYTYGVATGRLTLERFVAVTATNAARYFGMYPRKGVIAVGSDADIVVYDPRGQRTLRHDDLHDATDHTPYEGLTVQGHVCHVFRRGDHVVTDGTPTVHGGGQYIPRGLPDPTVR
ncbi:D-hydantoinase [Austwickia sp. TVS 96-490-7B]|uniref:dihydropyrimidinase n=1 Tax=Austwickia sp. TVS 96-490-7B TaxID=2830843 RepID=UPI001C59F561|nr:dihydropyrimidinase [Austwickia sp. TVS 96-490-7B]MBW3086999.1 D-hydantoinase [Austwickia sp. TVS 96-490-7B]